MSSVVEVIGSAGADCATVEATASTFTGAEFSEGQHFLLCPGFLQIEQGILYICVGIC